MYVSHLHTMNTVEMGDARLYIVAVWIMHRRNLVFVLLARDCLGHNYETQTCCKYQTKQTENDVNDYV